MILNCKDAESDLKGKDCKEDDEAEGDSCSYHDGVSCVDQAHLANTMLMLKSEKKSTIPCPETGSRIE